MRYLTKVLSMKKLKRQFSSTPNFKTCGLDGIPMGILQIIDSWQKLFRIIR